MNGLVISGALLLVILCSAEAQFGGEELFGFEGDAVKKAERERQKFRSSLDAADKKKFGLGVKKLDAESDKLAKKKAEGDRFSADKAIYAADFDKVKAFDEFAAVNDVSKNSKFALKLAAEKDFDQRQAVKKNRAFAKDRAAKVDAKARVDKEKFDNKAVAKESEDVKKIALDAAAAKENLFSEDQFFDSAFDEVFKGSSFNEFGGRSAFGEDDFEDFFRK